jgi:hypothetical protein
MNLIIFTFSTIKEEEEEENNQKLTKEEKEYNIIIAKLTRMN